MASWVFLTEILHGNDQLDLKHLSMPTHAVACPGRSTGCQLSLHSKIVPTSTTVCWAGKVQECINVEHVSDFHRPAELSLHTHAPHALGISSGNPRHCFRHGHLNRAGVWSNLLFVRPGLQSFTRSFEGVLLAGSLGFSAPAAVIQANSMQVLRHQGLRHAADVKVIDSTRPDLLAESSLAGLIAAMVKARLDRL